LMMMETRIKIFLHLCYSIIASLVLALITGGVAFAYQVDPLPPDNLVFNPWFRDSENPNRSSLDGWMDAGGVNNYWSSSQKLSNPSPDKFAAGPCGSAPTYCGTSARLNTTMGKSGGIGGVGVDAYLYQIIPADRDNTYLKYSANWVAHEIDPAEVTIYGGETSQGPWIEVWKPFHVVIDYEAKPPRGEGQDWLWKTNTASTPPVETTLAEGYPFYKLEIHARLVSQDTSAFKITGIYFTALPPLPQITDSPTQEIIPTAPPTHPAADDTTRTEPAQKPPLTFLEILLALIGRLLQLL
jgi:hypothetical protein